MRKDDSASPDVVGLCQVTKVTRSVLLLRVTIDLCNVGS